MDVIKDLLDEVTQQINNLIQEVANFIQPPHTPPPPPPPPNNTIDLNPQDWSTKDK